MKSGNYELAALPDLIPFHSHEERTENVTTILLLATKLASLQHHIVDTVERVESSDPQRGDSVRKRDQGGCHPTSTPSHSRILHVRPAMPQSDDRLHTARGRRAEAVQHCPRAMIQIRQSKQPATVVWLALLLAHGDGLLMPRYGITANCRRIATGTATSRISNCVWLNE